MNGSDFANSASGRIGKLSLDFHRQYRYSIVVRFYVITGINKGVAAVSYLQGFAVVFLAVVSMGFIVTGAPAKNLRVGIWSFAISISLAYLALLVSGSLR